MAINNNVLISFFFLRFYLTQLLYTNRKKSISKIYHLKSFFDAYQNIMICSCIAFLEENVSNNHVLLTLSCVVWRF